MACCGGAEHAGQHPDFLSHPDDGHLSCARPRTHRPAAAGVAPRARPRHPRAAAGNRELASQQALREASFTTCSAPMTGSAQWFFALSPAQRRVVHEALLAMQDVDLA